MKTLLKILNNVFSKDDKYLTLQEVEMSCKLRNIKDGSIMTKKISMSNLDFNEEEM